MRDSKGSRGGERVVGLSSKPSAQIYVRFLLK